MGWPGAAVALVVALVRWSDAAAGRPAVLLLWTFAPALMAWLGRPRRERAPHCRRAQPAFLGRLARRTWAFFEACGAADDHWLPPDNFQEHPTLVVAQRTSPTNIGLSLLANLSAYDFGYLHAGR